jgi:hypothetical protein
LDLRQAGAAMAVLVDSISVYSGRVLIRVKPVLNRADLANLADAATASAARRPITGSVTGRVGAARVEDKAPACCGLYVGVPFTCL